MRSSTDGPSTGGYFSVTLTAATTNDAAHFLAPMDGYLVEVSFYAMASTAGTFTLTNETASVAWATTEAVTADTAGVITAATLAAISAGAQAITKGDQISMIGLTNITTLTVVLTIFATGHVAASEANDS